MLLLWERPGTLRRPHVPTLPPRSSMFVVYPKGGTRLPWIEHLQHLSDVRRRNLRRNAGRGWTLDGHTLRCLHGNSITSKGADTTNIDS